MKIDLAKRRKVMERSRKLGHCICDPRRPCPCDVFTGQGLCPCAGERPDPLPTGEVRLTELVSHAGCASKIAPADLQTFLSRLPSVNDPAVISGVAAGEDAGIYRLSDDLCLIQTVDVMTPVVDDPHVFGQICAANCLSDIYAMGGTPRTALSILAFPSETLDGALMHDMLKGAMEKLAEAGVALIGGHSVKDHEIKLGFAITGTIDARLALRQQGAKPGDRLVLTKPLGVGVLNFARQIGRLPAEALAPTVVSMLQLNRDAAEAMLAAGASACTDVTGFGLFAHLLTLCRHAGVTAKVVAESLPAFPQALECLQRGIIPGAIERNLEFVGETLQTEEGVDPAWVYLGFDAQTSGGLLIAVPVEKHEQLMALLSARQVSAVTIGELTEKSSGQIQVISEQNSSFGSGAAPRNQQTEVSAMSSSSSPTVSTPPCCAEHAANPTSGNAGESQKAFVAFMRSVAAKGAMDERTKELMLFSLVLLARCGPCVKHHLAKAVQMGITPAELDEAAWCAIAIGGGPMKMFYDEALASTKTTDKKCC